MQTMSCVQRVVELATARASAVVDKVAMFPLRGFAWLGFLPWLRRVYRTVMFLASSPHRRGYSSQLLLLRCSAASSTNSGLSRTGAQCALQHFI